MAIKPMSEEVFERLKKYRMTVISPSTFKWYDDDPSLVVADLENHGFTECKCYVCEDEYESVFPLKERFHDSIIIEGKLKKNG